MMVYASRTPQPHCIGTSDRRREETDHQGGEPNSQGRNESEKAAPFLQRNMEAMPGPKMAGWHCRYAEVWSRWLQPRTEWEQSLGLRSTRRRSRFHLLTPLNFYRHLGAEAQQQQPTEATKAIIGVLAFGARLGKTQKKTRLPQTG